LRTLANVRLDRGVHRRKVVRREAFEPRGQPGRAPRFHRAKDAFPFERHRQSLAAAVVRVRSLLNEAGSLQPVHVARHCRRGDTLERREATDADPAVPLNLEEQRDLSACHAERVRLAAKLARELEERRAQAIRDRERFCRDGGHFVSHANKNR
jgi:hypothetical protein